MDHEEIFIEVEDYPRQFNWLGLLRVAVGTFIGIAWWLAWLLYGAWIWISEAGKWIKKQIVDY